MTSPFELGRQAAKRWSRPGDTTFDWRLQERVVLMSRAIDLHMTLSDVFSGEVTSSELAVMIGQSTFTDELRRVDGAYATLSESGRVQYLLGVLVGIKSTLGKQQWECDGARLVREQAEREPRTGMTIDEALELAKQPRFNK